LASLKIFRIASFGHYNQYGSEDNQRSGRELKSSGESWHPEVNFAVVSKDQNGESPSAMN